MREVSRCSPPSSTPARNCRCSTRMRGCPHPRAAQGAPLPRGEEYPKVLAHTTKETALRQRFSGEIPDLPRPGCHQGSTQAEHTRRSPLTQRRNGGERRNDRGKIKRTATTSNKTQLFGGSQNLERSDTRCRTHQEAEKEKREGPRPKTKTVQRTIHAPATPTQPWPCPPDSSPHPISQTNMHPVSQTHYPTTPPPSARNVIPVRSVRKS